MQVLHLAVYLGPEDVECIDEHVIIRSDAMDRILAEIGEQAKTVPTFLRLEDDSCTMGYLHCWHMSGDWTFEQGPPLSPTSADHSASAHAALA